MSDCTCWEVDPKYWTTHYGAVDPATMYEPNPECPEHFPENVGRPACVHIDREGNYSYSFYSDRPREGTPW